MALRERVVVTGGAGFIGSHLCDRLLELGYEVDAVDSFEDYYDVAIKRRNIEGALSKDAYRLHEANLLDLAEGPADSSRLTELVSGAAAVFHLAAQAGVRRSWGHEFEIYTKNNVLATQMVLESARAADTPKVVYASSSSVYGNTADLPMRETGVCNPYSPYGVTKLAAEHLTSLYAHNFGLPTASFRFFTVYGPRQRPDMAFNIFMRAILDGAEVRTFGDGEQTRDFTFVSDIVDGLLLGLKPDVQGVYNLGGGSRVSLTQAIDIIEDVVDLPVRRVVEEGRAGDVKDTWASLEKATAAGYSPSVTLAEGLRKEWEWMRAL